MVFPYIWRPPVFNKSNLSGAVQYHCCLNCYALKIPSIFWAAFSCMLLIAWKYLSTVKEMEEWPKNSWATLGWIFSLKAKWRGYASDHGNVNVAASLSPGFHGSVSAECAERQDGRWRLCFRYVINKGKFNYNFPRGLPFGNDFFTQLSLTVLDFTSHSRPYVYHA